MASNAGSPSGLSVGSGLSEGFAPKDYAELYFKGNEDRIRYGANQKQQKADLDKFAKDVFVHDAIDPVLQQKSADIGKNAMSDWLTIHQADPTDYYGKLKVAGDAIAQQKDVLRNSQLIGEFRKSISKDSSPEAQQALQLLNTSKSWDEFQGKVKAAGIESPYLKVGNEGEISAPPPPKITNETGEFQTLLRNTDIPDQDPMTGEQAVKTVTRGKPVPIEGGKMVVPVTETVEMPKNIASRKSAEFWYGHPNLREQMFYSERNDIKDGIVNVAPPDEPQKTVNVKNPDGSINQQALDQALHEKWFHLAAAGNLTQTKRYNEPYTPPQTKEGFDAGSGEGNNKRVNVVPNSDGTIGSVVKYISPNSEQESTYHAPYALKGDAKDASDANLDTSWHGEQKGYNAGHIAIFNPKINQYQMFMRISKKPVVTGSESSGTTSTTPNAAGGQNITRTGNTEKEFSDKQTWLVPVESNAKADAIAATKDNKGVDVYGKALQRDINIMNEKNAELKGKSTTPPAAPKTKKDPNKEDIPNF